MKIVCPQCKQTSRVRHAETGQNIECLCGYRFLLDENCIIESGQPAPIPPDEKIPDMIGNYKIESFIGQGGMGKVYKGIHPDLKIPVAVKTLKPEYAEVDELAKRFIRAAKICAKLDHPNIARIYDCGKEGALLYLVLEYVNGGTVYDLLEEWKCLEPGTVIEIGIAVCKALIEAEKLNIVHRDIKPDNIIRTHEGEFKLTDLGLAKQIRKDKASKSTDFSQTVELVSLGTAEYMPPEQAFDAKNCDARADIYSLGITLYQLAAGKLPFDSKDKAELRRMHEMETPTPPSELNPKLNSDFDYVIGKCLEKSKSDRYQSAEELMKDLFCLGECKPVHRPQKEKLEEDLPDNAKRKPLLLTIALIILLLLSLFLLGYFNIIKFLNIFPEEKENDNQETIPVFDKEQRTRPIQENPVSDKETASSPVLSEKQRELWAFAINFSHRAILEKKDYALAISNFKQLHDGTTSPELKAKAEFEIEKIEAAMEKETLAVMNELSSKAKVFLDAKDYKKAALLYSQYNGRLANETGSERRKISMACFEKAKALATLKHKTTNMLVNKILHEKYQEALSLIQKSPIRNQFTDIENQIKTLRSARQVIIDSFKKDKGKLAYLTINNEKAFVTVETISDNTIFGKEKIGKATVSRRFKAKDLSFNDRYKRLNGFPNETKAIYAGVHYYRNEDFKGSIRAFKKSGRFSSNFIRRIKIDMRESEAQTQLLEILKLTGLEENPNDEALPEKISEIKLKPDQASLILKKLGKYKEDFSETNYYKRKKPIINALYFISTANPL